MWDKDDSFWEKAENVTWFTILGPIIAVTQMLIFTWWITLPVSAIIYWSFIK